MPLQESFERDDVLTRENRVLKSQSKKLQSQLEKANERIDFLTTAGQIKSNAPAWMTRPRKNKEHVGIANLFLSDLHLDEVVKREQVENVNEYNREIAVENLHTVIEGFTLLSTEYMNGVKYVGACVPLGGDLFSGNIHEELIETNESPILASMEFWIDPMVAAIKTVADKFGKVYCPCVVGNHGRLTRKPRHKNRVEDNFDWFFCRALARSFKDDKRVTFDTPLSADCQYEQFGHKFRLTHGDQFRGGDGITGAMVPIIKGDLKKRRRQATLKNPYDVLLMGHWHSYSAMPGIIMNGSLKGYDEYAYNNNFGYERPIQAMWVTTPENGVTFSAPVYADVRR